MFTIYFTVTVPSSLHDNEAVYVTGSHEQLGNWDPNRALVLTTNAEGKWTGTITLHEDIVKFRYFIGYFLESEVNKEPTLIIAKWETHLSPRSVMPAVEATKSRVCRANVNDIFGFNGGREIISDGWILNGEQNQIILSVNGAALKFYKSKHVQRHYRLKILSCDLRHRLDPQNVEEEEMADEDTLPTRPSYSKTEIAPLTHDDPRFRDQNEFGELFHNSVDYFMYRTQSVAVEYLTFRIEVFSTVSDDLVAVGYALPSTLLSTFGTTSVPLLTTKGIPVGKIYFGYLFVRPMRLPLAQPLKMSASYVKHWKKRTTLEVGHRGMGNSYTKCAVARENTLHSLNSAAKNGADLVEFDVHLTKDKVAVVFHDFHVMVSIAKRSPLASDDSSSVKSLDLASDAGANREDGLAERKNSTVDYYQLAVKDLKLNQLRLLHLDHVKHHEMDSTERLNEVNIHTKVTGGHDEAEEHRPFPTLIEAFRNVSEECGFNIEVKYPMMQNNGINECDNYFEHNDFLDIILADVFNHAGQRRIVFSSFDPDICTMISLKQNKYPVLFLCLGNTLKHIPYVDDRTKTSMTAVKYAAGTGLMGVNFNSEDVIKEPEPILKARELGLITFVWGDELAEKKNVDYFKKTLLVDGVIYDRIGEGEVRSNVFTLEKERKAALFVKKMPSPVAQPRSNSIAHLNQHLSFMNGSSAAEQTSAFKNPFGGSGEWHNETAEFRMRRHNSSKHDHLMSNGHGGLARPSSSSVSNAMATTASEV